MTDSSSNNIPPYSNMSMSASSMKGPSITSSLQCSTATTSSTTADRDRHQFASQPYKQTHALQTLHKDTLSDTKSTMAIARERKAALKDETVSLLNDFSLVSEAVKRAEVAIILRDMEDIELS